MLAALIDTGASLALACASFGGVHVFGGPYVWSFLFLLLFLTQQALCYSRVGLLFPPPGPPHTFEAAHSLVLCREHLIHLILAYVMQ
jgi:hypothetical protein